MVEKVFNLKVSTDKTIEKLIQDKNVHYIHTIFNKDEGLPEHISNANMYMTVYRGSLSLRLDDQEVTKYKEGTVLNIPKNTLMNVNNYNDELLELLIIKTPAPV